MTEQRNNGMPYRGPYAVLDPAEVAAVLAELPQRENSPAPLASAIEKLRTAAGYDAVFRGPMR